MKNVHAQQRDLIGTYLQEIEELKLAKQNVNADLIMAKAARMQEKHEMFQEKLHDIKSMGVNP